MSFVTRVTNWLPSLFSTLLFQMLLMYMVDILVLLCIRILVLNRQKDFMYKAVMKELTLRAVER
ncbi:MAG: hypothetical protein HXS48_16010 [Theionarchaea archaeon]|nr:hypothetical protein [Theionarchaea archaeon]